MVSGRFRFQLRRLGLSSAVLRSQGGRCGQEQVHRRESWKNCYNFYSIKQEDIIDNYLQLTSSYLDSKLHEDVESLRNFTLAILLHFLLHLACKRKCTQENERIKTVSLLVHMFFLKRQKCRQAKRLYRHCSPNTRVLCARYKATSNPA